MVSGLRTLFSQESIQFPLICMATARCLIPLRPNEKKKSKKIAFYLLRIIAATVLIPIAISIMLIFGLYSDLVTIIAKLYFGKNYYDNQIGADAMWNYHIPESNCTVGILKLLKNDPETPEKMLKLLRDSNLMDIVVRNHPRFACLRKQFLGYSFFVRFNLDYHKIIRYMDDYNTHEEFQEVINRVITSNLPYNGEYSLEILIGRKPIEIYPGRLNYPVLTRYHHSITDGIGISVFLTTVFVKNGAQHYQTQCEELKRIFAKLEKPTETLTFRKFLMGFRGYINMFLNAYYHYDFVYKREPVNTLRRKLTGKKLVALSFEKNENLIRKMKRIKNVLNVAFSDVILGAVCASLSEYYQQHSVEPPREVTCINAYFLQPDEVVNMVRFNNDNEAVVNFRNRLAIGVIELPVDGDLLKTPLEMVKRIHQSAVDLRNSVDFKLITWTFNLLFTIFPSTFVRWMITIFPSSVIISNLPGANRISFLNDCEIEDMVNWTTHTQKIGVTFMILSYDKQLRLALQVDKGLIDNQKDVQELSDGVLRYIEILYEHIL